MAERPSRPRIQSASLRDLILELHSRTWDAHDKLVQQWTQYLFFVNSGGAGAVLAFLGTDKAQPDPWQVRATLIAFVVGLVLVGVARACRTKSGDIQGQRLIALMVRAKLYDEAPSGAQLKEGLTKTQKERLLDGVASWSEWSSFACAIVAAVIGGLGLFR